MKTLKFKNNDTMPAFGLGTWKSDPGAVYTAVKEAVRMGYRHIDCAAVYGNEKEVGKALIELLSDNEVKRKDLWITSKLWNNAHHRENVGKALDRTLEDLGLDYLDLYLIHWPVAQSPNVLYPTKGDDLISLEDLPLTETWEAMVDCAASGRVSHIGVSNCSIKKLDMLLNESETAPELNQIELHPLLQQTGMLEFCRKNQILVTAYSPLGSPDRPERLRQDDDPILLEAPVICRIAEDKGCSPAQVLIGWAIERGTAVIPKSVNPDRLAENLAAKEIELSPGDMAAISRLDLNRRYIMGKAWTLGNSPYTLENLWDEPGA